MSLHLGNLSSRIRRDELEHVFGRFGRCTVRIKDKFGFVDYEYPPNAEEALGALRGTRICGERITLAWSRKQTQPYHGHAGRERPYKQIHRRYHSRGDIANRKLDSRDRSGFVRADGHPAQIDRAKRGEYSVEGYVGERGHKFVQNDHEESNCLEANGSKSDRGAEKLSPKSAENAEDFDRYEPCLDDDEKFSYSTPSDCSPIVRNSEEKPNSIQVHQVASEHLNNSIYPQPCQGYGVGYKMEKCSKKIKMAETRSGLYLEKDVASGAQNKIDIEPSTYKNGQDLLEHEESFEATPTLQGIKNDYQEKKRSSEECNPSDKQPLKKARVPVSSNIHSEYTASGSQSPSRSTKSLSGSHIYLKSNTTTLPKHSFSSSSRSGSMSSHTRTTKHGSHQIPRSTTPPLMSSPRMQINEDHMSHEFKEGSAAVENGRSGICINPMDDVTNHLSPMRNYTPAIMGGVTETKVSFSPVSYHRGPGLVTSASTILTDAMGLRRERENKLMQMKNSEMEASQRSRVASSMSISSNEMCTILKNCGQKQPEDAKGNLTPDVYFGSGRLWPWEIIFFRRLKKGLISKENYERRLLQNQEFGIADKYIRSSSGWGELTGEIF